MNFLTLFLSFSLASKQIMEFVAQILQNQTYIYVKNKKNKKKNYTIKLTTALWSKTFTAHKQPMMSKIFLRSSILH